MPTCLQFTNARYRLRCLCLYAFVSFLWLHLPVQVPNQVAGGVCWTRGGDLSDVPGRIAASAFRSEGVALYTC